MSNASERIKYDSKDNIIVITALTEPRAEDIKELFDEVLKISELKNCTNVLLDGTKTQKLPSGMEIFSIGEYMTSQLSNLLKVRIAYVIPDKISRDFRFFDNVSTNRGADIHSFKSVDEAKEWLLSE